MAGVIDFGLGEETVDERTHILTPRGEMDILTAPQLGCRLFGLADAGKTKMVVDLSKVTFMDSTGIGVLLDALRQLRTRHASLALVCPTERILRPFQVSGLVGHLPIFATREAALGGLATMLATGPV
jgi:anti-sigma B factor antagonist